MSFLLPDVFLIDGENLVARFQAMKAVGRVPKSTVIHVPDVLVWTPELIGDAVGDIRRVSYYTTVVGDDGRVAAIEKQIHGFAYSCRDATIKRQQQVVPRVFKKAAKSNKSRSVDINIVIDALRYARGSAIGIVTLFSGDGDFASLAKELTHAGVQVHVSALSSGASPLLESCADAFAILDDKFFEPVRPDQGVAVGVA